MLIDPSYLIFEYNLLKQIVGIVKSHDMLNDNFNGNEDDFEASILSGVLVGKYSVIDKKHVVI